jgi:glycolate oxidase subunit GlcD
VTPELLQALRRVVGSAAVLDDPDRLLVYESDGLTQYRAAPAAVVLPGSAEEVAGVFRLLHDARVPVVPRGAGTGLSGGALATAGGIIVGTARLNRILEVDPVNRLARVEPGVVNASLTRATLPHGLIYAPDPSSQSACTLGGNVAENSGGPHCLKYGVTSRYVRALDVVLASGERVRLGGVESAGELDLAGAFTGSEGCFGMAVEIEVGLIPVPGSVRTLLAIFPSMEAAGQGVTDLMARGLLPAALEIIDRETIRAVEASVFAAGFPTDAGAALVVEFDGVEAGIDAEVMEAREACRAAGATELRVAAGEAERAALWRGRKKAFGAMGRIAPDLLVQDATVPRSRLPEVLARISEIGARHRLRVANVFHAGDGNLHPNLLFDRRDADELARVEAASKEIMAACIEVGGTITGEHGVGIDKRRYLPLVCPPPVLRAMGEVRRAFDPEGLCNPGKVLPDGWGPPWPAQPAGAGATATPTDREERHRPGPHEGIVEHVPADLVVRVRGDMTLAELERAVAGHGQWLPFDPPGDPEAQEVGATLLAGSDGPLVAGFGRMRDHVLGLGVRTHAGEWLELGGRVVKNVAGFDLVRLWVGSRGELGRIEEATLRLFPIPAADRTLVWATPDAHRGAASVFALGRALAATGTPVAALQGFVGEGEPGGAGVAARILGSAAAVEEVSATLVQAAAGVEGVDAPQVWNAADSVAWWRERTGDPDPGLVRLQVASRITDGPRHLKMLGERLRAAGGAPRVSAFLLTGGLALTVEAPVLDRAGGIEALAADVGKLGGRLVGPDGPGPTDDPVRARLLRNVAAVFGGGRP